MASFIGIIIVTSSIILITIIIYYILELQNKQDEIINKDDNTYQYTENELKPKVPIKNIIEKTNLENLQIKSKIAKYAVEKSDQSRLSYEINNAKFEDNKQSKNVKDIPTVEKPKSKLEPILVADIEFDGTEFGAEEVMRVIKENNGKKTSFYCRRLIKHKNVKPITENVLGEIPLTKTHVYYVRVIFTGEEGYTKIVEKDDIKKELEELGPLNPVHEMGLENVKNTIAGTLLSRNFDTSELSFEMYEKQINNANKLYNDFQCFIVTSEKYLLNIDLQNDINIVRNKTETFQIEKIKNKIFIIYASAISLDAYHQHIKIKKHTTIVPLISQNKINLNGLTKKQFYSRGLDGSKVILKIGKFKPFNLNDENEVNDVINIFTQNNKISKVQQIIGTNRYIMLQVDAYKWNDLLTVMYVFSFFKHIFELSLHVILP